MSRMEARRGVVLHGLLLLPLLFLPVPCIGKERSINMVFYMHDSSAKPKPTTVRVTAPMGNFSQPFGFGSTNVMDDVLTSGPSLETTTVGRGQGFYTSDNVRVGTIDLLLVFTVTMHSPPRYNGSTLCFMGSDRIALPQRDIAVVGGTGAFRFARGFATIETIKLNTLTAIAKFNVTLQL